MTAQQLFDELKNGKVKKVIIDGDYSAEIDDQCALVYCLGSEKIDVIGVNAAAFYEYPVAVDTEEVMIRSYKEIERVYDYIGLTGDELPYFEGARSQITNNPDHGPSDSPAARNIIKAAHESDERVYVIVTGPCTNVVSAYLLDPSIKDNIVVVWVGGLALENEHAFETHHEWNICADVEAAKILLREDIPLVFLPCEPHGTADIHMPFRDFGLIKGNNRGAEFFRWILPSKEVDEEKYKTKMKVMCDLAGPASVIDPSMMRISIIKAPIVEDGPKYVLDPNGREILYGIYPDSDRITADALRCIEKFVNR